MSLVVLRKPISLKIRNTGKRDQACVIATVNIADCLRRGQFEEFKRIRTKDQAFDMEIGGQWTKWYKNRGRTFRSAVNGLFRIGTFIVVTNVRFPSEL